MSYKIGDIVTLPMSREASNTYIIENIIDDFLYLNHPLFPECILKVEKSLVNQTLATLKESTERCLDFASVYKEYLDFNLKSDLEALCMYFIFKRRLTPKQKQILANICGMITKTQINNDINKAITLIKQNESLLDEFNLMWYRNFKGLFNGTQQITSDKQKTSIFNMAGFVQSQLPLNVLKSV